MFEGIRTGKKILPHVRTKYYVGAKFAGAYIRWVKVIKENPEL